MLTGCVTSQGCQPAPPPPRIIVFSLVSSEYSLESFKPGTEEAGMDNLGLCNIFLVSRVKEEQFITKTHFREGRH